MKKRWLCMALLLTILSMSLGSNVFADSGTEFQWFYDFEDYTGGLPDARWAKTMYDCSPTVAEEDGNKVLSIGTGELSLKFDELIASGNLHISYKIKGANKSKNLLQHFYDGRNAEGTFSDYSKSLFLNTAGDGNAYYYYSGSTKDMTAWSSNPVEGYDFTDGWHKVDLLFHNIESGSSAVANYYIDGNQVNELPIHFSEGKGFRTLSFRLQKRSADYEDGSHWYIDDVLVERINSEFGLNGTLTSSYTVPRIGAQLDVSLSDTVDPALLTKENISITRSSDGSVVSDFEVLEASGSKLSVKINEELGSGIYQLTLSGTVLGGFFQKPMLKPVEFRTEYQSETVYSEFINEGFENRTAEEVLSEWTYTGDGGNTWFLAEREVGGYAFEQQNVTRRKQNWMTLGLDSVIGAGLDFTASFDIKASNLNWYFSIITEADSDPSHNIALGCTSTAGILSATATGMQVGLKRVNDNLKVPYDEWHTVMLEGKKLSDGYQYLISVDGGESYPVTVTRDMQNNAITGLAFGYVSYNDANALQLDNLLISSDIVAYYPEVEEVHLLDIEGSTLAMTGEVTSLIQEIQVQFNTRIAEESMHLIQLYEADVLKSVDYVLDNSTGVSVVRLCLPALLEPSQAYQLRVYTGIASAYTNQVCSDASFSYSITTKFDDGLRVAENGYDQTTGKYRFVISKNNKDSLYATAAIVFYQEEVKEVDGVSTTFDTMVGFRYLPIQIEPDWAGTFEYEAAIFFDPMTPPDRTEIFLWSYPSMERITVEADGSLTLPI